MDSLKLFTKRAANVLIAATVLLAMFVLSASVALASADDPNPPTNITVTQREARRVVINWKASPDAGSYIVEVSTKGGTQVAIIQNITATTKVIGKRILKANKGYFVKIKTVSADDQGGAWSGRVNFRTKPGKVKNLKVTEWDSTSARLQWSKPRGTIKYYLVQVRLNKKIKRTIKTTKNVTKADPRKWVRNLKSGKDYKFRVRAAYNDKNKGLYSVGARIPGR